jgi:conjugative relaxase-like TrwC/TraI family protein
VGCEQAIKPSPARESILSDYLLEGRDQKTAVGPGGKLRDILGLDPAPNKEAFDQLCDGINPVDGSRLSVRTRKDRLVGLGLSADGPKSFSIIQAITQDQGMRDALRLSFIETLEEMEQDMMTRVQRGKRKVNVRTNNMLYELFGHETSRPVDGVPDMNPHDHAFIFSATWCEETGRTQAANFHRIIQKLPYYEAALQARLARRLEDMGFETERRGK